jgi:hypothetical protein
LYLFFRLYIQGFPCPSCSVAQLHE